MPLEKNLIPDDLLNELTQFHVAFSEDKFKSFFPNFVWKKSLDKAAWEYIAYHNKLEDIPPYKKSYEDRLIKAWEACKKSFKP